MGILKKIGKVFKKIGKGVKKVFKKFGKFMGKIGIVGNIAMMFILPGIGAALAKGFGAIWTGAVGQTAAQATAAANATSAVVGDTVTQTAIKSATEQALKEGATQAAANAAGEAVQQTALKAATKTAMSAIRAGGAITEQATGMLASELAVVRGAGMVLQKGAQFASTIASGYKTVSQAVTGAFEETGKWIGGKLGMKTAEGATMKGSWANYSQAVTDSFATLKDNATDFWSPIKAGPSLDVGLSDAVSSTGTSAAGEIANTSSNIASATGSELDVSGDVGTGAAVSETDKSLLGKTGSYFKENVMGGRTFSESIAAVPGEIAGDIAQAPVRILKDEANDMIFGQEKLPIQEEAPSLFGNYVPEFSGNAGALANTMGTPSDFGTFLASGQQIVPVNEAGYYGGQSRNTYYERMESFTNNPNTGVMA
jgi:hypothetical protein